MFLNDLNLINLSKFTVLQTITHLYKSGISVGQSKYHKKKRDIPTKKLEYHDSLYDLLLLRGNNHYSSPKALSAYSLGVTPVTWRNCLWKLLLSATPTILWTTDAATFSSRIRRLAS